MCIGSQTLQPAGLIVLPIISRGSAPWLTNIVPLAQRYPRAESLEFRCASGTRYQANRSTGTQPKHGSVYFVALILMAARPFFYQSSSRSLSGSLSMRVRAHICMCPRTTKIKTTICDRTTRASGQLHTSVKNRERGLVYYDVGGLALGIGLVLWQESRGGVGLPPHRKCMLRGITVLYSTIPLPRFSLCAGSAGTPRPTLNTIAGASGNRTQPGPIKAPHWS